LPLSCRVVVQPVTVIVLPVALLTLAVIVSPVAVVVPPTAVLPLAAIVPPVAILPLAVVLSPVAVIVPRCRVTYPSPCLSCRVLRTVKSTNRGIFIGTDIFPCAGTQ